MGRDMALVLEWSDSTRHYSCVTPLCRIISLCFFRSVKHKKLLLADYRFPCDLPCVGYPLLGNPTKNALSRSGPRTCPRSTDHGGRGNRCRAGHESCAGELASTVNTARSARRRAVSAQVRPWFLTARRRLKSPYAESCFHLDARGIQHAILWP